MTGITGARQRVRVHAFVRFDFHHETHLDEGSNEVCCLGTVSLLNILMIRDLPFLASNQKEPETRMIPKRSIPKGDKCSW
jgi:hypothetical protein